MLISHVLNASKIYLYVGMLVNRVVYFTHDFVSQEIMQKQFLLLRVTLIFGIGKIVKKLVSIELIKLTGIVCIDQISRNRKKFNFTHILHVRCKIYKRS
jgi:hypothetical protein